MQRGQRVLSRRPVVAETLDGVGDRGLLVDVVGLGHRHEGERVHVGVAGVAGGAPDLAEQILGFLAELRGERRAVKVERRLCAPRRHAELVDVLDVLIGAERRRLDQVFDTAQALQERVRRGLPAGGAVRVHALAGALAGSTTRITSSRRSPNTLETSRDASMVVNLWIAESCSNASSIDVW